MFRIRRIVDASLPRDRDAIEQVQRILRAQFSASPQADVDTLPDRLHDPFRFRFRTLLFVAERHRSVRGFALVSHEPAISFLFLDYLAADTKLTGAGVGGALYARVREEAVALDTIGVFCECAPDIREECTDDAEFRANVARLRFYERFSARPVDNTAYRTPVNEGDVGFPHLVYDPCGRDSALRQADARAVVRAILERKYRDLCPRSYIEMVVASFGDDPVRIRPPCYRDPGVPRPVEGLPSDRKILLVVNDRHEIHHVRERGYVEAPVRVGAILAQLEPSGLFEREAPRRFPDRHVTDVHDRGFVEYLRRACASVEPGKSVYPYVFPVRNAARPPRELSVRAGYYCIDTFTPLNRNAYLAARRAVDCTMTAAAAIEDGRQLAYALVRPPGHHAEHGLFGGFCYFNSGAIAAHYLSRLGRVAMLDIDYHHGNGQQQIFFERSDVLTVSIHGHPKFAYPYFSGFADETGTGAGAGFNVNYPLAEHLDGAAYRRVLDKALERIRQFEPTFLIVALGLDPASGDPTGTWSLQAADFRANGERIGALGLRTLVVQEGGYRTRTLGRNALHFFAGLSTTAFGGAPATEPATGRAVRTKA